MSGAASWSAVLPAMAGVHMLIGAGEAVITAFVLVAVGRLRPELLQAAPVPRAARYAEFAAYGLAIAAGLTLFVAPVASGWPDGLEKVAAELGFEARATQARPLSVPFGDYSIPAFGASPWSTAVAGLAGTLVAFALALVLTRMLVPGTGREAAPPDC
jgi:cobalt/nickel transport system permease protein